MSEGLSRRALFKGAAGAAATVATGGAGNVARAATIGGVSVAGASSVILSSLGETGGFPHRVLNDLLGAMVCNIPEGFERKYGNRNLSCVLNASLSKDSGSRVFSRYEYDDIRYNGKVNFGFEEQLLNLLGQLPQDIPIVGMLSNDVLDCLNPESSGVHGDFEEHLKFMRELRQSFEPFCEEGATAADLTKKMHDYFAKLARYAADNPNDFVSHISYSHSYPDTANDLEVSSDLDKITKILEGSDHDNSTLIENLKAAKQRHSDQLKNDNLSRIQNEYSEKIKKREDEETRKKNERKNNPESRNTKDVRVIATEQGKYIVNSYVTKSLPTRMDWLHWIQSLDPENAKASDIEIDFMGMAITIKNPVALQFLKSAAADTRGDLIPVTLPNRRMGVDLNLSPENG